MIVNESNEALGPRLPSVLLEISDYRIRVARGKMERGEVIRDGDSERY
jgi:hypothetical protein